MWIIQRVQEGAESLPLHISHFLSKNKEISAKTSIFSKLHSNVLTPDKIPEFFLPPKLTKRCLVADVENISQCLNEEIKGLNSGKISSASRLDNVQPLRASLNKSTVTLNKLKPIPYSLKCYESGLFESPNTRRKESLFHSALTSYTLERTTIRAPKLSYRPLTKGASTESDTPSADSTPQSSPPPIRRENFTSDCSKPHSVLKDKLERNVPHTSREDKKKIRSTDIKAPVPRVLQRARVVQTIRSSKLAPPIQFPLDMLHCQERFHQEHVLLLPQRGRVRLSAFWSSATGSAATVRIRVVSVEGLRDPGDFRPLTCSLTLSLTPGKLQRQHSAIIRNCRNPVFNEDFFFTESEEQEGSLRDLTLRLKVLDKASGLGRGVVLGIVLKPLCQLLPL